MKVWLVAALLVFTAIFSATKPVVAASQEQQEVRIGEQVFQQLEREGKIVRQSPYYDILDPLGQRIARVADKEYFTPFHFIIVRDEKPNAFAVPGGNVYVTEPMMTLVQNKEELAGVLCHEVSHTIHHDVYDLYAKAQRVSLWETLAQILLVRTATLSYAVNLLANMQVMHFSRAVEHNADMTGAYMCAGSGVTPWGMVWMMKRFMETSTSNPPEFISDHPNNSHRIANLEKLLADNPKTFAEFNSNIAYATPLDDAGLRPQTVAELTAPSPMPSPIPRRQASRPNPHAKPTCPPGWKFCR